MGMAVVGAEGLEGPDPAQEAEVEDADRGLLGWDDAAVDGEVVGNVHCHKGLGEGVIAPGVRG